MKQVVRFFFAVALVATVGCLSLEKDVDIQQIIDIQREMEAGCYSRNWTSPDGKQGMIDTRRRWPNGVVTYAWDSAARWNQKEKNTILIGMQLITSTTCIRFKERTNEKNYVRIEARNPGCFATMGAWSGAQVLNLNRPGCIQKGVVAHELMHTLGINHEQCRTDRDDYIKVHFENVKEGQEHNFKLDKGTTTFDLPYDFGSIMHYFRTAFSKNNKPTMVSKVPGKEVSQYGNYEKLTEKDIDLVQMMYNCE